ncbi:MAG TPA: hypothetical protein VE127_15910, partial [Solirubrobacteraceae bacterium]|nr:hypothetical protein [Solirubrobacteraceae bacterium]
MSRFFEDLERQLRAAASARSRPPEAPAEAPPRRRSWLRRSLRTLPAAIAVATTLAVAIAALLLLAHRRQPASPATGAAGSLTPAAILSHTPHAQLLRELALIQTATQGVL